MGVKVPYTPASKITSALRTVWMRSRERASALRQTNNRCCLCGVKQSVAKGKVVKLVVHHTRRPNWDRIKRVVREELLQTPEVLWPLCKLDHDLLHEAEKRGITDQQFADGCVRAKGYESE